MVNFMLGCSRCLKAELFGSKNITILLQRKASNEVIHIPQRKSRGPVDILQALAGTVKTESNVLEYRFQYGGIFDVKKGYSKRLIALSMDSGRKAAKWIVAQNPRLFQHKYADPYIKAFAPPKTIDENTEVSEEYLLEAIEDIRVEDAIKIYELMKEKNIDVSPDTKQILLELVCYYNCKNKQDETLIETVHCGEARPTFMNTWMKDGFAEKLFFEMEPSSESYSAMILGSMMYNSINKAFKLYDEAKEKGIEFGVDVYNALLEHATEKVFQHTKQEEYIIELLREMKEKNIVPNLGTLNSILKSVVAMKKWLKARFFAVKVFQEFKSLGIEPSLATYYYLVEIFSDRERVVPAFLEILDEMESKNFVVKHPDDFNFFKKAMETAVYNYKSIFLAHKVNNILMTGCNKYFLGSSVNINHYYRNYITATFRYDDLNTAVNLFERCFPQAYMPDSVGIMIILTSLKTRDGSLYLPRLWPLISETVMKSDKGLVELLQLVVDGISARRKEGKFKEIAEQAWENCKNKTSLLRGSDILISFLKVFSIAEMKTLADEVFEETVKSGLDYILDFESISIYTDLCISNSDNRISLACVEYAMNLNSERGITLAGRVRRTLNLTNDEEEFLEAILKASKNQRRTRKNIIQVSDD